DVGPPVREFASPEELCASTGLETTGCAVIHHPLTDGTTCEVVERLSAAAPGVAVVVVAESPTVARAVQVMRKGAVNVLEWPVANGALRSAVVEALGVAEGRAARVAAVARLGRLSPRHTEVLRHLLSGLPNKAVAARLGVGLRTAERLRSQTLELLGVKTLAEAAELWRDAGGDAARPAAPYAAAGPGQS
ncbi:MAG TPA: LuxR C-terminal-related transcriptional regulator, partial [Planctomycetaceae bacterium]